MIFNNEETSSFNNFSSLTEDSPQKGHENISSDPKWLGDEIYARKRFWPFFFIIPNLFLLSIIVHFAPLNLVSRGIEHALMLHPLCKFFSRNIHFSLLPMRLNLKELQLSPGCPIVQGQALGLNEVAFEVVRPSISPIGLKTNFFIRDPQLKFTSEQIFSMQKLIFKLTDSSIQGDLINQLIGGDYVEGNFEVRTLLHLDLLKQIPTQGEIFIGNKSLFIKPQTIQGLQIPGLNIGPAQIKMSIANEKLWPIKETFIGDSASPIQALVSGDIKPNFTDFSLSQLNLIVKFKLTQQLLEEFSVISYFLNGKEVDEKGFYELTLTGSMRSPTQKIK